MTTSRRVVSLCLLLLGLATAHAQGPLVTKWGKGVTPENAHREYPRPQMTRAEWINLNGMWQITVRPHGDPKPTAKEFLGQILVPFPAESKLSRFEQRIAPGSSLWYRRTFSAPRLNGKRLLLHFGAVDWDATLHVNGRLVGQHLGGYDPFSFDITPFLKPKGQQEIVLQVKDPTDTGTQPRGKQVRVPGGIFYTPTTGIWQTVWLEPVPDTHIRNVRINPSNTGDVTVTVDGANASGATVEVKVKRGGQVLETATGTAGSAIRLRVDQPKLWSTESPNLYDVSVTLTKGKSADGVGAYFAFREVSLGKDESGRTRLMLNGKPCFMFGPLDQGFWPDGLYTPPSEEAMVNDLKITKGLGFNMIRKHVKVEPARWYYWCDRLGILVWQDMVSGDRAIGPSDPDITRTPESAKQFEQELEAMMDWLQPFPSIVCWVIFNEGWGQFDTAKWAAWAREKDPTRLINSVSGLADRGVGDMFDWHVYPGPGAPQPEANRASVLGEFGGLGLPVEGHTWQKEGWGYQSYKTPEELTAAMERLFFQLRMLQASHALSAAVYTQTTDVETEINGLMTYDREIIKADIARLRRAIHATQLPPPVVETVVETSEGSGLDWRYTTTAPTSDWFQPYYSDSGWAVGQAGFGTQGTPGAIVRTTWNTDDIWLRRTFQLPADVSNDSLFLKVHHDDDAEIYLDGKLIASLKNWTTGYTLVPIPKDTLAGIAAGSHVLAMHVHQGKGGQYADVGIVRAREANAK